MSGGQKLEISRRLRHTGSTYTDPVTPTPRRFRVKPIPYRHHAAGKRKIRRRLDRPVTPPSPQPALTASSIPYNVADKARRRCGPPTAPPGGPPSNGGSC